MTTTKTEVRNIVIALADRADVARTFAAAEAAGAAKNPECKKHKALTDLFAAAGIAKSAFKMACNMLPMYLKRAKTPAKTGGAGAGAGAAQPAKKKAKTGGAAPPAKKKAKTGGAGAGAGADVGAEKKGSFKTLGGTHLQSIASFLDSDDALALATASKTTWTRMGKAYVASIRAADRAVLKELGVVDKSAKVGDLDYEHQRFEYKGRLTKALAAEGWTAHGKHPYRQITRTVVREVVSLGDPVLYISNYYMMLSIDLKTKTWKRENFTIAHNGEDRIRDSSNPTTTGTLKSFTKATIQGLYADVPQTGYNKLTVKMIRTPKLRLVRRA